MQSLELIDTEELLTRIGAKKPGHVPAPPQAANSIGRDAGLARVCSDGERTRHLVSQAGRLIRLGLSETDVLVALQGWNARNTPPLDDTKVAETVASIARTHERNYGPQAVTPLFDLASASIETMLRTAPPKRQWLLEDCLPIGIVGLIVAPGGTGKSQFMLQLGAAVATGLPLAEHWNIASPGRALLLMAEDEIPEIHRRLSAVQTALMQRHKGLGHGLKDRLYIRSMAGECNLMTRSDQRGRIEPTDYVDRLIAVARQIPDLRLVVVDPISRFRGGDENRADDATRFVEELERLRKALGCTVVACHHVSKGAATSNTPSQHALRGSSALTDGVRWQMQLTASKQDPTRGNPLPPHVTASVTKNNYGPPQDDIVLVRGDGGYLSVPNATSMPIRLEDRIKRKLIDEASQGRVYSKESFATTFAGLKGEFGIGVQALRKAIGGLVTNRVLSIGPQQKLTVSAVQPIQRNPTKRNIAASAATSALPMGVKGLADRFGLDESNGELQAVAAAAARFGR